MATTEQVLEDYNSLTEDEKNLVNKKLGLMEIPTIQTIYDRRMQFGATARKRNLILFYSNESGTDDDITKWHLNAKVSTLPIPKGDYQMAPKEGKKEKEFLAEVQANGLVFSSLDLAMQKHTIDLEIGIFDKKETYRCIFYKEDGVVRKLWCYHYSDGKLYLCVVDLDPVFVHGAPREFLCSKQE